MFSNLPTMLQQQDFQAGNRDMLEAARGGVTVADPKHARQIQKIKDQFLNNLSEMAKILERKLAEGMFSCRGHDPLFSDAAPDAKIGAQLRIRLPNDYSVTDGPGLSLQDYAERISHLACSESQIPPPSSRD